MKMKNMEKKNIMMNIGSKTQLSTEQMPFVAVGSDNDDFSKQLQSL